MRRANLPTSLSWMPAAIATCSCSCLTTLPKKSASRGPMRRSSTREYLRAWASGLSWSRRRMKIAKKTRGTSRCTGRCFCAMMMTAAWAFGETVRPGPGARKTPTWFCGRWRGFVLGRYVWIYHFPGSWFCLQRCLQRSDQFHSFLDDAFLGPFGIPGDSTSDGRSLCSSVAVYVRHDSPYLDIVVRAARYFRLRSLLSHSFL